MIATKKDIEKWFDYGVENGESYMLIICNTLSWDDYPAYENSEDCLRRYHYPSDMQVVMGIYDLNADKYDQLNADRVFNLPKEPSLR